MASREATERQKPTNLLSWANSRSFPWMGWKCTVTLPKAEWRVQPRDLFRFIQNKTQLREHSIHSVFWWPAATSSRPRHFCIWKAKGRKWFAITIIISGLNPTIWIWIFEYEYLNMNINVLNWIELNNIHCEYEYMWIWIREYEYVNMNTWIWIREYEWICDYINMRRWI